MRLAIASERAAHLRFIDTRHMRAIGNLALRTGAPGAVTWLRANCLLATGLKAVSVVDPQHLRVVRRTKLPGVLDGGAARLTDGLALLLTLGDGVLAGSAPFVPPDISVFGRDGSCGIASSCRAANASTFFGDMGTCAAARASLASSSWRAVRRCDRSRRKV